MSVSVVNVGKEPTNTVTTLFHKTCSGWPIAHLLPGRKLSLEPTPRDAPASRNGPKTSTESLTPWRRDLAAKGTVDFQSNFFPFVAALSLGGTPSMSPEG